MIKNNLVSLVTGSIIPLVLFPEWLVNAMRYLPFYYVTYLPSMLFTGRGGDEALKGIIIIGCWCVVMQVLIHFTSVKYFKKYDGAGI